MCQLVYTMDVDQECTWIQSSKTDDASSYMTKIKYSVLQYIVLGFIVNSAFIETEESPAIQYMRSLEDNFVAD